MSGVLGGLSTAIWSVLLGATVAAQAEPEGPAAGKEPLRYDMLRKTMAASGFQALSLKHGPDDYFCAGDDLCQVYPEVLSCVMAGAPACRMAFFNPGRQKYVLVITNSDHLPLMVTTVMDANAYDIADIKARQ